MGISKRRNAVEFGESFRALRKRLGKTQQWVAEKANVRRETISQLEAGENVGLHIVLAAAGAIGMAVGMVSGHGASGATTAAETAPEQAGTRLSALLGLSRTYDWSSASISEDSLILNVMAGECFEDLAKVVVRFGWDRVAALLQKSRSENPIHRQILERMLGNIRVGIEHAA